MAHFSTLLKPVSFGRAEELIGKRFAYGEDGRLAGRMPREIKVSGPHLSGSARDKILRDVSRI